MNMWWICRCNFPNNVWPEKEVLSQEVAKVTMCKLSCCTSQYGSTHVKKDGISEQLASGSDTNGLLLTGLFFAVFWDKKKTEALKSLVFEKTLWWIWNKCKVLFLLGWKCLIHVLLYTVVQDEDMYYCRKWWLLNK